MVRKGIGKVPKVEQRDHDYTIRVHNASWVLKQYAQLGPKSCLNMVHDLGFMIKKQSGSKIVVVPNEKVASAPRIDVLDIVTALCKPPA